MQEVPLGAALFANYHLLNRERKLDKNDSMIGSFLGPSFKNDEISDFLTQSNARSHSFSNEEELLDLVYDVLSGEKSWWFQGRMEFGLSSPW